ncbi:MAG: polyprenyl synthetase family protein [Candidatus Cyclobacteriaceae bacterium M3_2C_046]
MKYDAKGLVELINRHIDNLQYGKHPKELYQPVNYIMGIGGKRLRPVLSLLAYQMFRDDITAVLNQAVAVEVFHNFTLMHDDIMDKAPLRRGQATVHEKWDDNVAILSGDVMVVKAYDLLLDTKPEILPGLIHTFNACAAAVCEGQQLDMNFESYQQVSQDDYLDMIRKKTAVLIGFSLELGAKLASACPENQQLLKSFGEYIGIGFQLKDDLLDIYADHHKFGKQVGGDIIANKKTFLLIKALELASGSNKETLVYWLNQEKFDPQEKVKQVKDIYDQLHIKELTQEKMNAFFQEGFLSLEKVDADPEGKAELKQFAYKLIEREK